MAGKNGYKVIKLCFLRGQGVLSKHFAIACTVSTVMSALLYRSIGEVYLYCTDKIERGEDSATGDHSGVRHDLPLYCLGTRCPTQIIRYKRNLSAE